MRQQRLPLADGSWFKDMGKDVEIIKHNVQKKLEMKIRGIRIDRGKTLLIIRKRFPLYEANIFENTELL